MNFSSLHQQASAFVIANVWDVPSAQAAQAAGFAALGTSSAAVAALLGYQDGQHIPFANVLLLVERILSVTDLPLSVDLEAGYGNDAKTIVDHVKALADLGVVGINIEDSKVNDGVRTLDDANVFAQSLAAVKSLLAQESIDIFINVRTDTFLLNVADALQESIMRSQLYAAHGADGIFVPCIVRESDIATLVQSTELPVNVMCVPNLPNFDRLSQLGVKRISMGNFVFERQRHDLKKLFETIRQQHSFESVFSHS